MSHKADPLLGNSDSAGTHVVTVELETGFTTFELEFRGSEEIMEAYVVV